MGNNTSHDKRRSTPSQPTPPRKRRRRAALTYHRIKCSICRHPHREAIEPDYLHWHSPARIAREYKALNPSAIYRHAQAIGLDAQRRRNTINSLEFIIEKAASIVPTAREVINAVRACSRLNQEGLWIDPPRQTIVTHVDEHGNPLPTRANTAAMPNSQSKSSHVTDVTSTKGGQNQSPTRAIRNWFISLKTNVTRLIQSPTFSHSPKPQNSPQAAPQTASVSHHKIAVEESSLPRCLPASLPPDPCLSNSVALNRILPGSVPAPLRVSVTPRQNPASVDVHVAHLLL